MTETTATRPPSRAGRAWLAVTGLLLLSLVPVVAGAARLTELASGAAVTPGNARFDAPVPVVLHIVGATVFSVIGALSTPSPTSRWSARPPTAPSRGARPEPAARRVPLRHPDAGGRRSRGHARAAVARGQGDAEIARADPPGQGAQPAGRRALGKWRPSRDARRARSPRGRRRCGCRGRRLPARTRLGAARPTPDRRRVRPGARLIAPRLGIADGAQNVAPASASPRGVRTCSTRAPSRTLATRPLLRSTVRWCDAVDTATP